MRRTVPAPVGIVQSHLAAVLDFLRAMYATYKHSLRHHSYQKHKTRRPAPNDEIAMLPSKCCSMRAGIFGDVVHLTGPLQVEPSELSTNTLTLAMNHDRS